MRSLHPKSYILHPPALFIGRFQPFHKGHLDAIKQVLRKEQHVIIAIGSAQYSGEPENPFTASERYEMIQKTLDEEKIDRKKYSIMPVWNIENDKEWVDHLDRILPQYKNVYTGSPETKKLYKAHGKHPIKNIKISKKISATLVREKMKKKENWKKLVPKPVVDFLSNS